MVDVEVVRAVNVERSAGDAGLHHGRDGGAFAVGIDVVGARAREEVGALAEARAGPGAVSGLAISLKSARAWGVGFSERPKPVGRKTPESDSTARMWFGSSDLCASA